MRDLTVDFEVNDSVLAAISKRAPVSSIRVRCDCLTNIP